MWIIISTAIPIVLAIYGLSRLQQNRNSHGAQGPTCGTYTHVQFYNHENPDLRRQANTLQSAEERDEEAHKYLVKWDSDEDSEQSPALSLPTNVDTIVASSVEEPKQTHKHKSKQADVKWDVFEEK
jgi:hypothetical protein